MTTTPKQSNVTMIVWNGCDSYVEAAEAIQRGYTFDGTTLYSGAHEFAAFDAIEVDPYTLPTDEEGAPDFDGIIGSESGKYYRVRE